MKKYGCVFRMAIENAMEYRMDFLLSLISTVFPVIIQVFLWTAIYSGDGRIDNGYSYQQIILYTLMAGITSKIVSTGFEYEINSDIKDGGLNKYIVKPVNYWLYRLFAFLGGKIHAIGILAVTMVAVLTGVTVFLGIEIEPLRVLFFLVTLILAVFLNFTIFFCVAVLCFWITEISKFFSCISIVMVVISGGVFPIDIFGDFVGKVIDYLPFRYITQFSVDTLNGRLIWNDIFIGLAVQVGWITLFAYLGYRLWLNGMKKYVAIGG
jgi:ABC-2 type transport system permease protein